MKFPKPVKRNKFGELVADISVEKYYRQIMEEVLEAYETNICRKFVDGELGKKSVIGKYDNEAKEIADVITCCVTRLDIMENYEVLGEPNFEKYVEGLIADSTVELSNDFYTDLDAAVMESYRAANFMEFMQICIDEDFGDGIALILDRGAADEEMTLADIILMCIKYLEFLGYDEKARQKIYRSINNKNRRRGYFED